MNRTPLRSIVVFLSFMLAPASAWSQPAHWLPIGPAHVVAPPLPGLGSYNAVGRITTIAVHPTNPQIVYAGSAGQLGTKAAVSGRQPTAARPGRRSPTTCRRSRSARSQSIRRTRTASTSSPQTRGCSGRLMRVQRGRTFTATCRFEQTRSTGIALCCWCTRPIPTFST